MGDRPTSAREEASSIESEIVVVDDDGTEEPFDPSSWFGSEQESPCRSAKAGAPRVAES